MDSDFSAQIDLLIYTHTAILTVPVHMIIITADTHTCATVCILVYSLCYAYILLHSHTAVLTVPVYMLIMTAETRTCTTVTTSTCCSCIPTLTP